jgi:hypothetical protein
VEKGGGGLGGGFGCGEVKSWLCGLLVVVFLMVGEGVRRKRWGEDDGRGDQNEIHRSFRSI